MSLAWLAVLLPVLAAPLAALPGRRAAHAARFGAAALWLAIGIALCVLPPAEGAALLRPDPLNLVPLVLAGAIGLTAAVPPRHGADPPPRRAVEGVAWQAFFAGVALALLADHLALAWLGLAVATLAVAVMVGLGTSPRAARAGWGLLLLGGLGLALALFGLAALHRAAAGEGDPGLSWAALRVVAAEADRGLLDLGVLCQILGLGALAGLAPLGAPRAAEEAASPPVAALLSGVLPVVALHGALRAKALAIAAQPTGAVPAIVLGTLGLAALLLAALALWRRRAAPRTVPPGRLLAWAGLAQTGAAAFAFGLGGAAANRAGLLLLLGQALVRSGLHLRAAGRPRRGDPRRPPDAAWTAGLVLLAGLPPGVLFAGQLALMAETAGRAPWLLPALGGGIALAMAALLAGALRPAPPGTGAAAPDDRAGALPVLHLLAASLLGVAMPAGVARFLDAAARLIG
jgi:hydrogenase-4 component F